MILRLLLLSRERRVKRLFHEAAGSAAADLTIAEDMKAGLRLVQDERYDVIFADAEFPGLSRSATNREVRKSRLNSQTPIFLLTGFGGAATSAPRLGPEISMLAKPSSAEDLAGVLQQLQKKLAAERRRSGRLPFRVEVNCLRGVLRLRAFSVDLNADGMLLDVAAALDRGDDLELYFSLSPGDRVIRTRGRVVRRSQPRRVGVVFEKMGNFDRQRIKQFLELHMMSKKAVS